MSDSTSDPGGVHEVVEHSLVVALLVQVERAYANSLLARAVDWFGVTVLNRLANTTRHAFLYRWLTTEPDPEVIVIDLRETYTVGPIIAKVNRAVIVLAPVWRTSRLKRGTDGVVNFFEFAAQSKTGKVIATCLEPPEPPDDRD